MNQFWGKMGKRKILVCGATGFIGRNITEHLAQRNDVEVHAVRLSRPEYACDGVTWHQADLRCPEDVERVVNGMDVIIQAAATTSGAKDIVARPYLHVTDNAVMNALLFRAAHEHKIGHVIFFSCTVMYPSSERPLREEDFDASVPLHPRYFGVGWTKIYTEKMCEFYADLGQTKYTVIRHSNVYGPYDKFDLERSHVFGATLTKVMTSSDGRIVVWGTGDEGRDLIYVGDLVNFVELALDGQEPNYRLYNVGTGEAIRIKNLVARIVQASGRELRIEHDLSQPTIPTHLCVDFSRAERELGWRPRTSLDDGIHLTLRWWRDNSDKL
jgi:nucleoside-diphosphate-sugar epimerase